MYSDRKIGDCLGPGKITKGQEVTFGGDGHVHCLDCGEFHGCIYIYVEHIRLSTFNMCHGFMSVTSQYKCLGEKTKTKQNKRNLPQL